MPFQTNHLHSQIKAAAEIWPQIQTDSSPADRWLGNYFHHHRKIFGSRDRRFLSETIYSLFRHKTFLEVWAKELGKPEDMRMLVLLAAAREGFMTYDQLMLELHQHHATFESSYRLFRAGELPASFKAESDTAEWAARYSFPEWIIKRWRAAWGDKECRLLFEALNKRPPLTVRANPLKITRDKLAAKFRKKDFKIHSTPVSPWGITFEERVNLFDSEEFREGLFEVQDEGSQIVCHLINPKPDDRLWDVCAGGGGKSLLLAALMQNKGRLVATDIRMKKLDELRKRAQRAGVFNIFPADLDRMKELREARNGFNKILVDAPCSGTGTFRRNPDAKWKVQEGRFEVFHRDQVAIVENSLPFLAVRGKLYYVTCSLESIENAGVIEEILGKHPELKQLPFPDSPDGFMRLFPHRGPTDGFFLAILEKKN